MSAGSSRDQTLTPWTKVKGTKITYPLELGAQDTARLMNVKPKNSTITTI